MNSFFRLDKKLGMPYYIYIKLGEPNLEVKMRINNMLNTGVINSTIQVANKETDKIVPLPKLDLKVFHHHIYEYKKGLRELILTTEKASSQEYIESRLQKEKISYLINKITDTKINVFFGSDICIKVVERFNSSLNKLTPEEDFILGTMLGYSKLQQCERYLRMKDKFSIK